MDASREQTRQQKRRKKNSKGLETKNRGPGKAGPLNQERGVPMKNMKTVLLVSFVWCLVIIAISPLFAAPKQPAGQSKSSSCIPCHADFSSVLPKEHKPVKSGAITMCTACHKPDLSGKAEPKPFSARLHRPHTGTDGRVECTLCHSWTPGRQLGIKGTTAKLGAVSRTRMPLLKESFVSWSGSTNLDAIHGKANIVCLACHGKTLPDQGDTVENGRCLACHGSMEALAARSAPKDFPDRNPHKSHLGEIACTVCHHGHTPSKVYCLGCHQKFNMKIPGG